MIQEFKDFINKGGVFAAAVGLILALAFAPIVASLVADVILPIVGAIFGAPDFSNLKIGLGTTETLEDGTVEKFDQAIIAAHSDEALAMRPDADAETRALLGAVKFTPNRAILHRDPSLMPKTRKAWSSWNTVVGGAADTTASLTYWMNRLQNIDAATPLFVTLNPQRDPAPDLTFGEYEYAHPFFDTGAFEAQKAFDAVQGRGGIWHAGAWLGYGFHEDGIASGLRVCAELGTRWGEAS